MTRVLLDTSVLFASLYSRDAMHDEALSILHGIDDGSLPEGIVLDFVLAETINGLQRKIGSGAARDFLERMETNARFHVERLTNDALVGAKSLFRRHERVTLVDAAIMSYAGRNDVEYLYAFDDDFDVGDGCRSLTDPINPYEP